MRWVGSEGRGQAVQVPFVPMWTYADDAVLLIIERLGRRPRSGLRRVADGGEGA